MSTTVEIQSSESSLWFWLANGALTGAIAGAAASNLFILFWTVFVTLARPDKYDNLVEGFGEIALILFLFGQIFGTLPAVLLGIISGILIGFRFYYLYKACQLKSGAREGLKVAFVLAVVILFIWAWISQDWVNSFIKLIRQPDFLYFLSAIILLYLASGFWAGWRLVCKWQKVTQLVL